MLDTTQLMKTNSSLDFSSMSTPEFERLFIDSPLYDMVPATFCSQIEQIVKEKNIDYWAAATMLCEEYEIEFSQAKKLITDTMKDKIELAAHARRGFKRVTQKSVS